MDIENMDIEDVKAELTERGIKLHHKTGEAKLRATLQASVDGTYEAPVAKKVEEPAATPPKKVEMTKEQRALRLVRIIVSPNDPLMASYPGLIFTVCSSSVNSGKAVKKYVPFNNEEGWHVPHIIFEQIQNAEMQKFKPVKMDNGETVLQPYTAKMYNIQELAPLSEAEIKKLAASQTARGDA